MSASVYERLAATLQVAFWLTKLVVFLAVMSYVMKFLWDMITGRQEPNYYVISALLWMKGSLESQMVCDWSTCVDRCITLVLEVRVLIDKSRCYTWLGILFEASGLHGMLQRTEWKDVNDVHGRVHSYPWRYEFCVTLTHDGNQWQMSSGLGRLACLRAWLVGQPWCVTYFCPEEGESNSKWHKAAYFEVLSCKESHIKFLLDSAKDISFANQDERSIACAMLVRAEKRSHELVPDV